MVLKVKAKVMAAGTGSAIVETIKAKILEAKEAILIRLSNFKGIFLVSKYIIFGKTII